MLLAHWPTGRRIAVSAAFCLCVAVLIVTVFRGISDVFLVRGVQTVAIGVAAVGLIGMVVSAITGRLSNYTDPADERMSVCQREPSSARPLVSKRSPATTM